MGGGIVTFEVFLFVCCFIGFLFCICGFVVWGRGGVYLFPFFIKITITKVAYYTNYYSFYSFILYKQF